MSKTTKTVLIVCAIILVCCIPIFFLALFVLAVPAMQRVTIKANETAAIFALRSLNRAETQYSVTYPERGFSCSMVALGGDPASGPPTADAAHLIPVDLAYGDKAGYNFVISNCAKKTADNHDAFVSYKITAVPDRPGHTGVRSYCTDESGEIRFDPKGGTNCTEVLQ